MDTLLDLVRRPALALSVTVATSGALCGAFLISDGCNGNGAERARESPRLAFADDPTPSALPAALPSHTGRDCSPFFSALADELISSSPPVTVDRTTRTGIALELLSSSECVPGTLRAAAAIARNPSATPQPLERSGVPVRSDAEVLEFSESGRPLSAEPTIGYFSRPSAALAGIVLTVPEYLVCTELAVWLHDIASSGEVRAAMAEALASAMVDRLVAQAELRLTRQRVTDLLSAAGVRAAHCEEGDPQACNRLKSMGEFLGRVGANEVYGSAERRTACRLFIQNRIRVRASGTGDAAEGALSRCQSAPAECSPSVAFWEHLIRATREQEELQLRRLRLSALGTECDALGDAGLGLAESECSWTCSARRASRFIE